VSAGTCSWAVILTAAAEADYRDILRWTAAQFGAAQALIYAKTLSDALAALAGGPTVIGVKARDDIAKGLFTLHVARGGLKGRHFVLFRIGRDRGDEAIEVLRLLHDAMELARHLPPME